MNRKGGIPFCRSKLQRRLNFRHPYQRLRVRYFIVRTEPSFPSETGHLAGPQEHCARHLLRSRPRKLGPPGPILTAVLGWLGGSGPLLTAVLEFRTHQHPQTAVKRGPDPPNHPKTAVKSGPGGPSLRGGDRIVGFVRKFQVGCSRFPLLSSQLRAGSTTDRSYRLWHRT